MNLYTTILLTLLFGTVQAQDIKQEINTQVWKTFIEGYNTFNTDQFMSVYSKNVTRVPLDQKKIFDYSEFRRNINRENQFNKNYNIKANIELRFKERIHTPTTSYETGIYKIRLTDNNGKPATIYSSFQVLMKKENGMWKIHFDSDAPDEGRDLAKEFEKAQPL